MNHKAQVRITETVAVLFIFFVLVLFAMVFYYQYQKVSFKEKNQELLAARAMDTTIKTLFMPELQCTRGEAEPEDNCFDVNKLQFANDTIKAHANEYYFQLFSYSRIIVQETYLGNRSWRLYDHEKTKVLEDGSRVIDWISKEPTYFVVSLREEMGAGEPKYSMGYVVVEVYS